jgi:formate dehydrogenase iron-sulfur subunit
MTGKAFLVDTTRCTGCRSCQVACKQWNNLPPEKTFFFGGPEYTNPAKLSAITFNHVKFFPADRSYPGRPIWEMLHLKCNHCEEANCIKVCPQSGISKVNGWVVIDQSKCIGCGACESECAYQVPHVLDKNRQMYGLKKVIQGEKSYKCDACTANRRNVPACATNCPTGALTYGDRDVLLKRAKAAIRQVRDKYPRASLYGETQFGGLRVITILKDSPEKYGLPLKPKAADAEKAESVRDVYRLLSRAAFGLPSLKRAAYRLSRSIVG